MSNRAPLLLLLACFATSAAQTANDPMVGQWKLNPQKSRLIDEMKVASLGGNKYSFDFGGPNAETIAVDGTDQPGIVGTSLSVTATGANEWTVVRKKDGRIMLRGIWTLSQDGNQLHDDYTEFGNDAKVMTHVVYLYDRRGEGSGFAADWLGTPQQMDPPYVIAVRPYEGDGLSIIPATGGASKNVKFDGADYPNTGAAAKSVSSARRVNERTVELTDKIGQTVLDTEEISVSEDGKTLTITMRRPKRSEPDVLVLEKQ